MKKILVGIFGILIFVAVVLWVFKFGQKSVDKTPVPTLAPTPTADLIEGKSCGGIAGNLPERQCPSGYQCQLAGDYPDASGVCVKE